jgi:small-conductance mechanosensitive channel/CRP-like cAMP-binding protein
MVDLLAAIEDPLVQALVVLTLCVVAARFLFRGSQLGRAMVRLLCFILLTFALLQRDIVPYQPVRPMGPPVQRVVTVVLEIAWWLWAAWLVVGILRRVLVFEQRPRESKLLQDLVAGLAYLAAIFAIIAYVFNLPVQGLLATSGVIAIILGLALQSTLGDVFSGLVLSLSRPYRPDDWIRLDGDTEGRVLELNWRATLILTSQHDLAIVPNSVIAKSKVVNVSAPSGLHGMSLAVRLDPGIAPAIAMRVLRYALLNTRRILPEPEPSILVKSMSAVAVEYELFFFVEDLNATSATQNECFDLLHRHLRSAGIALAAPSGQPQLVLPARRAASEAETALEQVPIFAGLTPAERADLAGKLKCRRCGQGEVVLSPGAVVQSLYLVGAGVLSVVWMEAMPPVELLRLGPGDHYGEIGLLERRPSIARISTLTPVVLYELPRSDLAPLLEARPDVAHDLARELAERQAAGRLVQSSGHAAPLSGRSLSDWFAERLRRILDPDRV